MTHEYAVRSGHPKTRTTSATPIRLHSLTKSMPQSKIKLHNVQEKTCGQLHTVQFGGMSYRVKDELKNEWVAESVPLLTTDKVERAKRYTNKRDAQRTARVLAAELNRCNRNTVVVEAYL